MLIAALIVAPFALRKFRQIGRMRRAERAAAERRARDEQRAQQTYGHLPALEDVIADISFVVDESRRNGGALLVVPHEVTVSDRPAPPEIVDALVRDALRRSNLVVTAEADSPEGRVLECALVGSPTPTNDP